MSNYFYKYRCLIRASLYASDVCILEFRHKCMMSRVTILSTIIITEHNVVHGSGEKIFHCQGWTNNLIIDSAIVSYYCKGNTNFQSYCITFPLSIRTSQLPLDLRILRQSKHVSKNYLAGNSFTDVKIERKFFFRTIIFAQLRKKMLNFTSFTWFHPELWWTVAVSEYLAFDFSSRKIGHEELRVTYLQLSKIRLRYLVLILS